MGHHWEKMKKKNLKQVIVMRTDLNMRKGKMIAQGSHASMLFLAEALAEDKPLTDEQMLWLYGDKLDLADWNYAGMTKVVLGIGSHEELVALYSITKGSGLTVHWVVDAGKTELPPGTKTCLAIGPDNAELIDHFTKDLKLL